MKLSKKNANHAVPKEESLSHHLVSPPSNNHHIGILLFLLLPVSLTACMANSSNPLPPDTADSSAAIPTTNIAQEELEKPMPLTPKAEVYPSQETQPLPSSTSEGDPGAPPKGVPAAPNLSLITARVENIKPFEGKPGTLLVEITVIKSEPIPGYADFGSSVVGQTIQARWQNRGELNLEEEALFTAELRFQGDEHGGVYFLENVNKK